MDIKCNGITFQDAIKSDAGVFVSMYCISELGFGKQDDILTLEQIIKVSEKRLSLLSDRLVQHDVINGVLEPVFKEDGTITYEKV